jgi:eukaryotic-like serine/threonine-protein kinase
VASGLDETALDTAAPADSGTDDVDLPEVSPQRYEIAGEVGRGGLGRVVEAKDRYLDRKVALKELLATDGQSRRRFVREALITARLQHPSIVPVYEAGRWPDRAPFYAMKLVAGQRLLDKIKGSLADRLALVPTVLAVADAIGYAHSERIVHRDLKPQNVLVGAFGETVVIDWGLAKDLAIEDTDALDAGPYRNASADHTVDGAVMGTPAYMPPEQAEGQEVDERADVYALGAMLYHVISGRAPHVGDSVDQMIARIVAGAVDPVAALEPEVPADLATIVEKAMARSPAQRYPNAAAFADDLRRFTTGQLVAEHRYTAGERVRRWLRRHRAVVAVAAIAGAVLIAFGTWSIRRIVIESRARGEKYREAIANGNRAVIAQARGSLVRDPAESLAWLAQLAPDGPGWDAARVIAAEAMARPRLEHAIAGTLIDDDNWRQLDWQRDGDIVYRFGNTDVTAFDLATERSRSYAVPAELGWVPCADHRHLYGMHFGFDTEPAAYELDRTTGAVTPLPAADDEDYHGFEKCVAQPVFEIRFPTDEALVMWDPTHGRSVLTHDVKQAWPTSDRTHVIVRDLRGDVTWWDGAANQHEKIGSLPGAQDAPEPALSADGRLVVFGGRPMSVMRVGAPPHTETSDFARVSKDGTRIAFANREPSPASVDITDRELSDLAGLYANGRVTGMRFSTDNQALIGFGDRTTIWDLASRMRVELGEVQSHHDDFLLDDDHLGRWSVDGSLRVWRIVKPHVLAQATGYLAAISANAHWAVDQSTAGTRRIDLTHAVADEIMPPDSEQRIITRQAISNDGSVLLEGRDTIAMWRRGANPVIVGKRTQNARVRWSTTGSPQMWGDHEVFELSGASARLVWKSPPKQFVIAISDDLRLVVVVDDADHDKAVRVVDLATRHETVIPMLPVRGIVISSDDRWIAGPMLDGGGVVVWDLATGEMRTFATPGTHPIQFTISRDRRWLAANSASTLATIDLATGAMRVLPTLGDQLTSVVLDPDGRRVAATSGHDTRLFDLRSGESRTLADAPAEWVAFDGDRIVIGMSNAVVDMMDDLPHDPEALSARIRALPFEIRAGVLAMVPR